MDIEWNRKIYTPSKEKYNNEYAQNINEFNENLKQDWYDLDFRFLKEHPNIRAFNIYEHAEEFINEYMKEFVIDAFENHRKYICEFYHSDEHGQLYREHPYLNAKQADDFVKETVDLVIKQITNLLDTKQ